MEYREFRAESVTASDGTLEGLVTPFGRETVIGDLAKGGFREEVTKGAFTKTLREGDPLMVYQHDLSRPLARKSAGNLELREGADGLAVKAQPADTSYARDLRTLIEAGVIQGMSFGFTVTKDEWRDEQGNLSDRFRGTKRFLHEVRLIEVSPVTRPAYEGTSIMARDEASALIEQRQSAQEDRSPKPYGNVAYADPKNGKYPIDRAHVKAAWAYINQAKNAAKYPLNGVTLSSVKARIKAAMKKFGFTSGSAGGKNAFEFVNDEWRDDDPYFDDWYEIDADLEDDDDGRAERDDPDGKEYEAIDTALRQLKAGDVKGAEKTLAANQAQRAQEPDSSTPEPDDREALRRSQADALRLKIAAANWEAD
jgi:uncharacterized protein